MSRIRVMAVVLVVPALVVMLQVTNAFACTGYQLSADTECLQSGKTKVVVKLGPPGADSSGAALTAMSGTTVHIKLDGPTPKTFTGFYDENHPSDVQVIATKEFNLQPGTYTVSSTDTDLALLHATFVVETCSCTPSPSPSESPSPSPSESPSPSPSASPTPKPSSSPTPASGSGSGTPGLPNTGLAH